MKIKGYYGSYKTLLKVLQLLSRCKTNINQSDPYYKIIDNYFESICKLNLLDKLVLDPLETEYAKAKYLEGKNDIDAAVDDAVLTCIEEEDEDEEKDIDSVRRNIERKIDKIDRMMSDTDGSHML